VSNEETTFQYFLKATAEGGEVYWSDQLTFISLCGGIGIYIKEEAYDDHITYIIESADLPWFQFERFQTESEREDCTIIKYELFQYKEDAEKHPYFPDDGILT